MLISFISIIMSDEYNSLSYQIVSGKESWSSSSLPLSHCICLLLDKWHNMCAMISCRWYVFIEHWALTQWTWHSERKWKRRGQDWVNGDDANIKLIGGTNEIFQHIKWAHHIWMLQFRKINAAWWQVNVGYSVRNSTIDYY